MRHEEYIEPIPGKLHNLTGADTDLKTVLGYTGAPLDLGRLNDGRSQPEVSTVRIDGKDYPLGPMIQGPMIRLGAVESVAAPLAESQPEGAILYMGAAAPVWGAPFYQPLDALPTTKADMFAGLIVYNKTAKELKLCETPGEHETDSITVTTGAVTKAGDITVTLNEQAVTVAVLEDDTATVVATKIKAAVDAAVTAETIAAWTVARAGAKLTFTKAVVGACAAPTAADAVDPTGCVFSDFARDNVGAATVWKTIALT